MSPQPPSRYLTGALVKTVFNSDKPAAQSQPVPSQSIADRQPQPSADPPSSSTTVADSIPTPTKDSTPHPALPSTDALPAADEQQEKTTQLTTNKETARSSGSGNLSSNESRYIAWSDDELQKLRQLCTVFFSSKDAGNPPYTVSEHWERVASQFEGRSAVGCRKRWFKNLATEQNNTNTVNNLPWGNSLMLAYF